MKELITTNQTDNGEIIVSGRELHEFLEVGSQYTKWFDRMVEYGFSEDVDYKGVSQKRITAQGNTTTFTDHHLKLDMAKEISMLQRSDRGKQARQYFLQLEKMWNSPEMVMKRALEYADKQVEDLKSRLALQQPKVLFAEALETSQTSILVGELAKLLKQNGVNIGQNRLFDWLRDNGYLIKRQGEQFNLPTQYSMDNGWFEIKKRTINNPDGSVRVTKTSKVTGKGQVYFINKFLDKKRA